MKPLKSDCPLSANPSQPPLASVIPFPDTPQGFSYPLDRNDHNSLPFKGRVRVGMGVKTCSSGPPHPHPSLPLEGEGAKLMESLPKGYENPCGVSGNGIRGIACEGGTWRGFGSKRISGFIAALLFACTPSAHADKLGRLFLTPEQRTQLDYTYARTATADSGSSPVLTVNGIVQKNGGARTVWINGVAQSPGYSKERTLTSQTVAIPGSPPVKLKVGEKILLDQPVQNNQDLPGK